MTKLFCISLVLITAASAVSGQTRQITPEEWGTLIRAAGPWRAPAGPYRLTHWWNSLDQGDSVSNSSSRIVTEYVNAKEGCEVSEGRLGGKPPVRGERIWKDGVEYSRTGGGKWVRKQSSTGQAPARPPVAKSTDSTKPGSNGEPPTFARKPGSEEILFYSLGERLYKGRMVGVYEEVTRHVLIRLSDKTEIHYENRTRHWLNSDGRIIRTDRNYVIYSDDKTTRILSGTEWEVDPLIKPVTLPID